MFPFWSVVIAPLLQAAGAERVVEIGALRGDNTQQIIDRLGPGTELHVIDPAPDFDPAEHERRFAGRYRFHQDRSINVLGGLPPMDAALIDGDHNWYTVINELRLLREVAEKAGEPLPLLFLHDVGWPYGRRDLYYDPEAVPEEHRQPWRRGGIRPGQSELVGSNGLNPTMCNAETEGGPHNGVMTALEDFIAEHAVPVRLEVFPVYFGLAVAVDEARLQRAPEIGTVLDRLQGAEGKDALLKMTEDMRLRAMVFQHSTYYPAVERLARVQAKYLRTVKAALLNEHYLENELRLRHLTTRLQQALPIEPQILRDPVRQHQQPFRELSRERTGPIGPDDPSKSFVPYTAMGLARLNHLEACLDRVREEGVAGDLVECGTGHGGGAIFMRAWLDAHEVPGSKVWVADRFRSAPEPDKSPSLPASGVDGFRADLNLVRDGFERFGLLDDRVRFLQGPVEATLADATIEQVAVLRIGSGLDQSARHALGILYGRISPGGWVIVDDRVGSPALDEAARFRTDRSIEGPLIRIDESTIAWRKSADEAAKPFVDRAPVIGAPRAPLAPPLPAGAVDLSVVVVFHNMRREADRTLRSLSRSFQEGVADVDYEVIAIDNGSDPEERLDAEFVAAYGPEFRLLDLGAGAHPSPVMALNQGVRAGRGRAFALMIDGAHVVTPGVIHYGLSGLKTYAPAIVATQQWYVGPGQQGEAMRDGYDRSYEDRLFEAIEWPRSGYRLFEIGHFIGDRDWLDGLWESNAMFVDRSQLEQAGCFDESFSEPGGGYANLELYERLGSSAGTTVVTMLGEGSFHQLHGGDTTNQPDPAMRRLKVFGYGQHYAELRGRPFRGPGKPIHYVGCIRSDAARRTRARRLTTSRFSEGAAPGGVDGPPTEPRPIPDELVWSFTEAVWHTIPWASTNWLGEPVESAPTDLLAYQEAICSVRPDWVIETSRGDHGRTLFLASVCEMVGYGQVVSVGILHDSDRPLHPRLTYLNGPPSDPATVERVRDLVGADCRGLVILGSRADRRTTMAEFGAYAPLVPVDSFVVVADTIVNGHPVWTGFGPGPTEAVKQILARDGRFVSDTAMEKYSLSFNSSGYLRRVK